MRIRRSRFGPHGMAILMMTAAASVVGGAASGWTAVGSSQPAPAASGVVSVSVDEGPFSVNGALDTARSEVRVRLITPVAVGSCSSGLPDARVGDGQVVVTLIRTAGGNRESALVYLDLVRGSTVDGVWSGAWRIGATRAGTWTVAQVAWCHRGVRGRDERVEVDPRAEGVVGTLKVVSAEVPEVTVTRRPRVADYGSRQTVTLTFRNGLGAPLRNQPITVGRSANGSCGTFANGDELVSTDARGRISFETALPPGAEPDCAYLATPQQADLATFSRSTLLDFHWASRYEHYQKVRASPNSRYLSADRSVRVTGLVFPAVGEVLLQRRGADGWLTVAHSGVRASGRFVLSLRLLDSDGAGLGEQRYRVLAVGPPRSGLAPTASGAFVVAGT